MDEICYQVPLLSCNVGSIMVVSDKRPETMARVIVVMIVIAMATFVNLT